jgi:hypothetical protein
MHNIGAARSSPKRLLLCGLTFGGPRPRADRFEPGRPARAGLHGQDSKGNSRHLSEYRGKPVVLEWTNADCPYTRKHYTSGNMQSVQKLAQKDGVVWLSVISSAPGKQGYVDGPAPTR